jgi:hypothetical protein
MRALPYSAARMQTRPGLIAVSPIASWNARRLPRRTPSCMSKDRRTIAGSWAKMARAITRAEDHPDRFAGLTGLS